ncbi:permease prefix domain 1-containing protein [Actinomycetaceae bacterium L2_0104]
MDVINAYLETMFSPYPQTQRLLEAKEELRGMMEDAYNEAISSGRSHNEAVGQVITDFGNLDELAPVLGISADIHPSAPQGESEGNPWATEPPAPEASSPPPAAQTAYPRVSMQEAMEFSRARYATRSLLAYAVALFVISPSFLIGLAVFGSNPSFALSEDVGSFVGLVILLAIVAIGVGIMLHRSRILAPFNRISEGHFEPDPVVTAWAEEQRAQYEGSRQRALQVAIALWIFSAIPTLASGLLSDSVANWGEQLPGIGVPLTLLLVAAGLLIFLPANWASSVYDVLSDPENTVRDEMAADEDTFPRPLRALLAVIWPVTLIVFLLWSFIGNAWHISWIVWPVAGVLTWALYAIGGAWGSSRN